jgi:hypothetical protein
MGLSHSPKIVTDGLVLYLDAANPKSYPGSGTTWFDLSGKANHATLVNAPTFSNKRCLFNGTNQHAVVSFNANDFTFDYEQTIIIVLQPTENDGARRNPYNQAYAGAGSWTHESSGSITYFYGTQGSNGTPYTSLSSSVVGLNETAIVATTRKSAEFRRWYKNGILSYDGSGSVYTQVITGTQPIYIGTGYAGSYQGYIDYVAVYNKALTTEKIQQNFNAIRGRFGI